jgi:hypothetical protein
MNNRRAFRPSLIEPLEHRIVLSQAALGTATNFPVPGVNFATVQDQLNAAFNTFRVNYKAAEASYLSVAAGGASTVPGINTLTDLRGAIFQQVSTVAADIQGILSLVPGGLTGLAPALTAQLTGQFNGGLFQDLASIPGNTGPNGGPDVLYAQVSTAEINAAQLAANDLLTAYWSGWVSAKTFAVNASTGAQVPTFNYRSVQDQVNRALDTLRTNYQAAEANFLSEASSGNGSSSLSNLHDATAQQIATLRTSLQSAVSPVPNGARGLVPALGVQVGGAFTGSLGSVLTQIPADTGPDGAPGALYSQVSSDVIDTTQLAANNLLSAYNYGWILGLNASGFGQGFPANGSAGNPIGPAKTGLGRNFTIAVSLAYAQFDSAYTAAIKNSLDAGASGSGTVDVSANQAAFNAKVASALAALNLRTDVIATQSNKVAPTLAESIQQSLTGTAGTSLQAQLAALPIPTDLNGATTATFLANASTLINESYLDTIARLNANALDSSFNFLPYMSNGSFLYGPYGSRVVGFPFTPPALAALSLS